MSIKVLYFASLKDSVGRGYDEYNGQLPRSARQIWTALNPDLPIAESTLAAVNMEYAKLDVELKDGDELAFFPPVTGG